MPYPLPRPLQRLEAQFAEFRGFAQLVPPLIDRERRWEEIGSRPGDPDVDMIDVYESEAGPEEGWGHADYAGTVYRSTVVLAWEAFHAAMRALHRACWPVPGWMRMSGRPVTSVHPGAVQPV